MNPDIRRAGFGLRPRRLLPALLAVILLLSACSKNKQEPIGEPATIKVMYYEEQSFNQEFGMLFSSSHPNIDIQVVDTMSAYNTEQESIIANEKPDILMLNMNLYEKYAAAGKLVSLEPIITRDGFDLEGLLPGLVDLLREKGGGELYGLTPSFSSQVLYYNKDLFDRFRIEYPTDRMSWEEVLNLAARFTTDGSVEDRIWGLNLGPANLHQIAKQIALTQGLRVVNPADKRVSIDTESWVRVYETALQAISSGTLYDQNLADFNKAKTHQQFLLADPFISGKVAMASGRSLLLRNLREAARVVPDEAVKNWDMVTMPVDPANPEYTHSMSFYDIFAINAESANREAAWEFISYVLSDEFAQAKSKTFTGMFPIRTKYIRDEEGKNLAAFYSLKPSGQNLYAGFMDLPEIFYTQYDTIGAEEMQAVMDEQKTIREALASMQTRLQTALDQALANQESGGGSASPRSPVGVSAGTASAGAEGEVGTDAAGEGAAE
jgi:multiple sugar transport system substrate-binding protein